MVISCNTGQYFYSYDSAYCYCYYIIIHGTCKNLSAFHFMRDDQAAQAGHISWPPGLGQDGPQGFVLLNAETGSSWPIWYFDVAMEHHHFNLRQRS